ncbi:MAG: carboxypeptidase-like regulatory domain-containing protein [Pedobacter sp.]|uniref:carboxypeptidase-like regulatory domain-containing protein n=1 Tax=Pedobacter sp. TaxID=1411316 RepID=UPI003398523F
MIKYLLGTVLMLVFCVNLQAQKLYSITGVVQDKKGETLPGAGIYLSGYTTATVTNNDGQFNLAKLKPGSYEVVVQMMGYLPYSKSVIISDQSVNIKIILQENTVQLNEVVITADPNREKNLQLFKEFFIGRTPNSAKCKILNPQVLYIKYDGDHRILSVTSNEFLVVENKALGYRLKYMLNLFEYNFDTRIVYFSGLPVFEDLKGSGSKRRTWLKNREIAYAGSPQHFFQALYRNKVEEEGFIIYKRIKIPNPNRPSDAYLAAARARLLRKRKSQVIIGSIVTDSLNTLQQLANLPKDYTSLDMSGVSTDTLVKQMYPNMKTINYKDELYVMYTKEEESIGYSNTGHYIMRPLTVPNYEISVVQMLQGPVSFYANGGMHDAKSLLYEGFWAYEKIGDMVPMDYVPLNKR